MPVLFQKVLRALKQNWTKEAPCRSTTKSSSSPASPKLVDYFSTDSESSSEGPSTDCPSTKKRIHRMPAEGKTNWQHVVPITTRRSNIVPKWYDNFLARSKHEPVTVLNYFFLARKNTVYLDSAFVVVTCLYRLCTCLHENTQPTHLQIHQRSALRLRRMCSMNGGLFVKVGQHIGSLEYLLPLEYVNTFKVFHSSAPSTPLHRLKQVIKEEFGVPG